MSIVRLKKISIAGQVSQQTEIILALQQFGRLHILGNEHPMLPDEQSFSPRDTRASEALLYLQRSKYKRRALQHVQHFDFDQVVDQALVLKQQQSLLEDQLTELRERIERLKPWGDFQFLPHGEVKYFRLWFYRLPIHQRKALAQLSLPWQIVGHTNTFLHVVIIHPEEPPATVLPVAREHLGAKNLRERLDEEEHLESQLEDVLAQRQALTRYLFLMQQHVVHADNQAYFCYVMHQAQQQQGFFSLQAWLPKNELNHLQALSESVGFAWVAEDPQPTEQPPTLLQPIKGFGPGANLASIYQLPGYHGWDPSVHLYLWFSLFFAMVLADAGYAALLGGILALSWNKLGATPTGFGLRYLFRFMVLVGIGWGMVLGSYFGFSPPADAILSSIKLLEIKDYDRMMKLSVLVGVIHIVVANVSLAWQQHWPMPLTLAKLGWVILVISGFCRWALPQTADWQVAGGISVLSLCMALGALLVFSCSSSQRLDSWRHIFSYLAGGFLALTNLTKLFGDALSYMRLFALGLASASLAMTFNQLAGSAWNSGTTMGAVGAVGIFVVGHGVNLALGILSGVVHGLRLNFIEFYNWAEPGEGHAFTPFALKEAVYE